MAAAATLSGLSVVRIGQTCRRLHVIHAPLARVVPDLRILVDTIKVVVFGLGSKTADAKPGLATTTPLINETRPATSEDAA